MHCTTDNTMQIKNSRRGTTHTVCTPTRFTGFSRFFTAANNVNPYFNIINLIVVGFIPMMTRCHFVKCRPWSSNALRYLVIQTSMACILLTMVVQCSQIPCHSNHGMYSIDHGRPMLSLSDTFSFKPWHVFYRPWSSNALRYLVTQPIQVIVVIRNQNVFAHKKLLETLAADLGKLD